MDGELLNARNQSLSISIAAKLYLPEEVSGDKEIRKMQAEDNIKRIRAEREIRERIERSNNPKIIFDNPIVPRVECSIQ